MAIDPVDDTILRAIGGDRMAQQWITAQAEQTDIAIVLVMAALLDQRPERLERARHVAVTTRDRQVVEIARAHLAGDLQLVDALARDHLVDHPDSLIVAWIAGGSSGASDAGSR